MKKVLVLLLLFGSIGYAQTPTGTWFRPAGSGALTWSTLSWESSSDSGRTWTAAATAPTGSEYIIIQAGDSVTIDVPLTLSGYLKNYSSLIVGTTGTLTVTGTYEHALNAGTIPTATWGTGSTCLITGTTSNSPGGNNQNFYNFTWNCPNQSTNLNLGWDNITIGGNVTCLASGTNAAFQFRFTNAATVRTIKIMGDVIVNGGLLTVSGSSGAAQYNITVAGNIRIMSGKMNLCSGSGGFGTWRLLGDLIISSGIPSGFGLVTSSNTTANTRLIFCKNHGTQQFVDSSRVIGVVAFGVDSGATVQMNAPLTIGNATRGFLVLTNGTFVTSSTNLITMGSAATISGASDSSFISGPLGMTVTTLTKSLTFPVGKGTTYRPVVLNVTQDATTSTVYTAEMFNSAPPTRPLQFILDRISSTRYYTISKGTGAGLPTATVQLTYGADDGVTSKDSVRIAKSDVNGWISIGGSGTANNVGTITSNAFGTATFYGPLTTNDFVLGHANPLAIPVLPTVVTTAVTDISTTFATSGGNITNDGNAAIQTRGVCWNTTGDPTIADSKTTDGYGAGSFTSSMTGLDSNATYYVRAYATNSIGTSYGEQAQFTTLPMLSSPTVTTNSIINLIGTTATARGTVTAWGGATVTDRGFCWSQNPHPTLANSNASGGTGLGNFSVVMGGLTLGGTYYLRAYATNSIGTAYGNELQFGTPGPMPTVIKFVAGDGTGDYRTVQAAFDSVPSGYTGKWVIFVKKGMYYEKLLLSSAKTNVVLIGEDRDSTVLWYDDFAGKSATSSGTSTSYSVAIDAPDFEAQNITFQNTSTIAQAVALRTNNDRQAYYDCNILGYQDTYYTWGGGSVPDRIYNKNCRIQGSVDFIFGRDVALFDSCTIDCNREGGTLTAGATVAGFAFGYVFRDCNITSLAAGAVGFDGRAMVSFYLGRPWQDQPRTVFMNCVEPATLNAAGWLAWGVSPALYAEYNCTGPGSSTAGRVSWSSQLTADQAAQYTTANIFSKSTAAAPYSYPADWMPARNSFTIVPPWTLTSIGNQSGSLPKAFALKQNYPNPFNPSTRIDYNLPETAKVSLIVYDVFGRVVSTLADGVKQAGSYHATFDGSNVASGVYFARLKSDTHMLTIKLVLMK